jgi:hypothetical protein
MNSILSYLVLPGPVWLEKTLWQIMFCVSDVASPAEDSLFVACWHLATVRCLSLWLLPGCYPSYSNSSSEFLTARSKERGSMYGIYGNIYHQYTPVMLALIYHTWILWDWRGFHRFPSDPSVLNLSCQMLCEGSHGLQLIESTQRHRQASLFCRPMGTTWYNLQLHQMRMIKSHDKSWQHVYNGL